MSIKKLLFGAGAVSPGAHRALAGWRELPETDLMMPISEARLLVVDLAVTGSDLARDHARGLAVAVVENKSLRPDSLAYIPFDLPPPEADSDSGLSALLAHLGKAPLVTYQAPFFDALLGRAMPAYGEAIANRLPRIDVAQLLARYFGAESHRPVPLGHWLQRFGIDNIQEHDALCDAYAIGQLLLIAMARAEYEGAQSLLDLVSAAAPPVHHSR